MNCNSVLQDPFNIEILKKHYFYKREKNPLMNLDDILKYEQDNCNNDYAYTGFSNFNKDDDRKSNYPKYKDGFRASKEAKQIRILIAESERELLLLFKTYLESMGLNPITVDNGDKALDVYYEDNNNGDCYDAVVLDTQLSKSSGLEVAKKIHDKNPHQKIVIITTSQKENLPQETLKSIEIKEKDILIMPFNLSTLVSLLKN